MSSFYKQLPRIPTTLETADITITGPITVSNEVEVKNDAGNPLPVNAINFDIRDLNFSQDKIDVSGSTVEVFQKEIESYYSEILSVGSGNFIPVITKIISTSCRLLFIEVSGSNIAEYEIVINGVVVDKKRTDFGKGLNCEFCFKGLGLIPADVVVVRVRHNRPFIGDFNAKLIVEE